MIPVAAVTEAVQCLIRHAPAQNRKHLWVGYNDFLKAEQEIQPSRMPWEDANAVTDISVEATKKICTSVLRLLDDSVAISLMPVLAAEFSRLGASENRTAPTRRMNGTGAASRHGVRQCALPTCDATFSPYRSTAIYCSPAHRQAAYTARRKLVTPGGQ